MATPLAGEFRSRTFRLALVTRTLHIPFSLKIGMSYATSYNFTSSITESNVGAMREDELITTIIILVYTVQGHGNVVHGGDE